MNMFHSDARDYLTEWAREKVVEVYRNLPRQGLLFKQGFYMAIYLMSKGALQRGRQVNKEELQALAAELKKDLDEQ